VKPYTLTCSSCGHLTGFTREEILSRGDVCVVCSTKGDGMSNKVEDDVIARLDAKRAAEKRLELRATLRRVLPELTPRERELAEELGNRVARSLRDG
jgi:hypothetical protein